MGWDEGLWLDRTAGGGLAREGQPDFGKKKIFYRLGT